MCITHSRPGYILIKEDQHGADEQPKYQNFVRLKKSKTEVTAHVQNLKTAHVQKQDAFNLALLESEFCSQIYLRQVKWAKSKEYHNLLWKSQMEMGQLIWSFKFHDDLFPE